MAIAITTTQAAQNLHLKECRHAAFARLAAYHLRLTSSATPTSKYGSPDHLNSTTLSILLIHGAAIWPAYLPRRGHLTSTSTAKAGPGRGLLYAKDSRLVRAELKAWRAAHEGREPDEEEQLLGSPLGRLLRAYLEAFVQGGDEGVGDGDARDEVDEEGLLAAVVGDGAKPASEDGD